MQFISRYQICDEHWKNRIWDQCLDKKHYTQVASNQTSDWIFLIRRLELRYTWNKHVSHLQSKLQKCANSFWQWDLAIIIHVTVKFSLNHPFKRFNTSWLLKRLDDLIRYSWAMKFPSSSSLQTSRWMPFTITFLVI